jgi:hypothetical protein
VRLRPTPATILAGLALFFALGGTALAVSHAVKPQARCANGAVRGLAVVTGESGKGIANLPDQFSSSGTLFLKQFNCTGGATSVRRLGLGVYDVQFAGNPTVSAVVSASGATSYLQVIAPGTFRVGLNVPGRDDKAEVPFIVAAF